MLLLFIANIKILTSISKNAYVDKLDDLASEYNNTYHSTIKMKPVDVKPNTYIDSSREINNKDSKFKLVILLEYLNVKIFLQKITLQIGRKNFLSLKIKNTVPWTYFINDFNEEEIVGTFYEKELRKRNQKQFSIEKVIKRKGKKLYFKWKVYNNSFNSGIENKDSINE